MYYTAKDKKSGQRTQNEKDIIIQWQQLSDKNYAIEQSYGYSEYQLHTFVSPIQKKFAKNIGSLEAQKLVVRAFHAVEKIYYHQANNWMAELCHSPSRGSRKIKATQ